MQEIPRKRQAALIALLLVLCAALLPLGCSGDCPSCATCPEPVEDEVYDGRLYVTMINGNAGLYVIDLATDAITDSVVYPWSMGPVDVSPDGRYIAASGLGETLIYDAVDMSLVRTIKDFAKAQFRRNGSALIGAYKYSSYIYSFPGCQLEWSADSTP
jgi:hypothetical protein